uniref:Leucine rich repeat containing 20 n=1 Tax=Apteryx owenii TaxID=8824 RepID=A0A8B9S8S4_APTOW
MQKRMGEAVARVARRVNDTVENKSDSLDLAECKLMTFPVGIYKAVRSVADGIHRITLANNELKALASRFVTTFSQLRELNLEGNYLHRLPEEVGSLLHLRAINLSRNRFWHFPEPLAAVSALETIELEENEIAGCSSSAFAQPRECSVFGTMPKLAKRLAPPAAQGLESLHQVRYLQVFPFFFLEKKQMSPCHLLADGA